MSEKDTITITSGSGSDSLLDVGDTIVLDIGDIDTNEYSYISGGAMGSSTIDTITVDPSWTISSNGANYYTTGATNYNWASTVNSQASVNISNAGIDMAAGTDIKVDGKSLKEFMSKMEQRLSILMPDPAKLEKFEALKRAYEHYKTMESLCFDEPEESK
jgi:hypothetical protein